jgi:protease I
LAKARVLEGRKATVWDSGGEQAALLEKYGAEYTGDTVTVDGLIVTANGPAAAEEFGRTLAALQ